MKNEKISAAAENTDQELIFAPFVPDEESPYIFVSYAHKDRDRVFPIIRELYKKGWRVWYDEGIPIGKETDYLDLLAKHISECELVVAFVSNESVTRKFVTEKELEYACGSADRRVVFCYLDKDAELPRGIQLLTAKKDKYPRTDRAGLEAVLEGIEGLTKTEPREAKGYEVKAGGLNLLVAGSEDEYRFEKCEGGVRLTRYNGSEETVVIPEVYKGQPVVELYQTFVENNTVKTVFVPATVRSIGYETFDSCESLTDIYIPASVHEINYFAFFGTQSAIHCAEGTTIHGFASKENNLTNIIDNSMTVSKTIEDTTLNKFAFCSYAVDKKDEAERIIAKLSENGCSVIPSGSMTGEEKLNNVLKAECVIAFVSDGYINGSDILYLRTAKSAGKSYIIYNLDGNVLPDDMNIGMNSEQQLRYDSGTEKDRIKKLINLLSDNGCIKASADIPNFEYTTDTDGNIILTRYTGNDTEIDIPSRYENHIVVELRESFYKYSKLKSVTIPNSVTEIGRAAFFGCSNLTSVVIPKSVKRIGQYVFSRCSSLTSIIIPDSVESICDNAFSNCSNLISAVIPDSVTSIYSGVLYDCENVTVYCSNDSCAWKYCEKNDIPHMPLEQYAETPAENPAVPAETKTAPELVKDIQPSSEKEAKNVPAKAQPAGSSFPTRKQRRSRAPLFVLLVLLAALAAAAGVQLSGLFDILGWLSELI